MLHRPITFDGDRFLCEEKSLKAEKALFASRCEKSLRTSKGRALVSRFRYQWSLATWVEHFRETRDLSSDDEAPAPLPLEEISDAETLELSSDDEGADILLALGNAPPPPVVEVREKPVKKVSIPTRFTQDLAAPLDFQVSCFTGRCCCRAWTPTHTATSGAIKDRKTTFGGACKHGVDKDSTTVYDLSQNWCEELGQLGSDYDGHDEEKARLYWDSSEYWRGYPELLDKALTEKFGPCEGNHNWATALKVCGTHRRALNCGGVRTFGGPTGKADKAGNQKFHSLIMGDNRNRGEMTPALGTGDYHIQFNEQGFIWEDPSQMVFYNWEGSSSSGDQKAQKDDKWVSPSHERDPEKVEIYGKSRAPWKIKNAIARFEYREFAGKWQEEGWKYL